MQIDHIKNSEQLGVALKRLRKKRGLSQKDLALKMNMRQPTISDIENGRGTLDSFFKIIQALQVDLSLGYPPEEKNAKKAQKKELTDMLSLLDE